MGVDSILHYKVARESLELAADEGLLDVILWGSAFGRLRPRRIVSVAA